MPIQDAPLNNFIEQALHQGYAAAPKKLVASWYGQVRFTKACARDIRYRAANHQKRFGPNVTPKLRVLQTPTEYLLLVRDEHEW